ncbi:Os04g0101100 [Oryza sativa Japonica Group]|uniref:Os04g0101100 protein n=1 Tax=Oryza sativa subsp. japonica TaxID=39947 RepID=A0A0P0W600_ORYSJ|nr:Os04g0101100 [Oryza sativa Japonica Group]
MGSSNTNANNSSGGGKDKDDETSPSFKEGERVLAYHGPLLYEAKVHPYLPFHSNPTRVLVPSPPLRIDFNPT